MKRRKVRHEDPCRSRSPLTILLLNGGRCKREVVQAGTGVERGRGVAGVVAAVARSAAGGGGGQRVLACVYAVGGAGGGAAGDGASAAGEGHCIGEVEKRPGGFRD